MSSESSKFYLVKDGENPARAMRLYDGAGSVQVKDYFRPEGFALPALLLIYVLEPGTSEGLHTHNVGDQKVGSYDEFYYIIEGVGTMQIGAESVAVGKGDYVFVPNGVSHDVENTGTGKLVVHLVAMRRD